MAKEFGRWFRFYDGVLDDPKVQRLPDKLFRAEFMKAMRGEESAFADFIAGPFERPPWSEWALIRAYIFERDDYTCRYCSAHGVKLECDHVIPVAKGGTHIATNLVAACVPCNRSKADKDLEAWLAERVAA